MLSKKTINKALVTGGCGFIGGHLVDELIRRGKQVVVVDNESSVSAEKYYYNKKAAYMNWDILFDQMELIFKYSNIDTVFHLAAKSRIPYSVENPAEVCENNFTGTLKLLELSRRHGIKRFIYSSTSSVYGLKNEIPLTENMKRDCLNPYSVSKAAGEDLCKIYHSLYGLETVIFRYFNVYGERQPLKGSYAPVVGIFYRQKENGEPMTIVGDGLQTRDFTHVSDVVEANFLAAETLNSDVFGEVMNVGAGQNHSILNIARMIEGKYVHIPARKGESEHTLADTNKIKKLLGFEPKIKLEDWIENKNNETKV